MIEVEIIEYFLHNGAKIDGFCTDLVKNGLGRSHFQIFIIRTHHGRGFYASWKMSIATL